MKSWVIIGSIMTLAILAGIVLFALNIGDKMDEEFDKDLQIAGVGDQANLGILAQEEEQEEEIVVEEVNSQEECSNVLSFDTPVDITKVVSILYPGQTRGGDYKPHGGFRFSNEENEISVKIPYDSYIVRGSRYRENGIVQYLMEFMTSCNVSYRFDHLLTLSKKLQEIADDLPEAIEGDSRTTNLEKTEFLRGEEIAIAVGTPHNVFLDFGVYDLRKINEASKTSVLIQEYPSELASHGVCWFDWLSPEDATIIRSLPDSGGSSGKNSEYC